VCGALQDSRSYPIANEAGDKLEVLSKTQKIYYDKVIGHLSSRSTYDRPYLMLAAASGFAYNQEYSACDRASPGKEDEELI